MRTTTIVGAGPAGASAGFWLASRGHAVTLVDRAAFPRSKTCGDWIAQGSLAALAEMGLTREEYTYLLDKVEPPPVPPEG